MITKELFIKFITNYQIFDKAVDRISTALIGNSAPTYYCTNVYESDWYSAVEDMLDSFLCNNFTNDGIDLIYYFLFENCDHIIYEKQNDLFNKEKEIKIELKTIDDLWNYMTNNNRIKIYVKEINN